MPVLIPVKKLMERCNPYGGPVWRTFTMTQRAVRKAILQDKLEPIPGVTPGEGSAAYHARRIAYLVLYGWDDAISIDVGCPALGFDPAWPLDDGNHRMAAAIFRGDEFISASVGGDLDYAFDLFGVSVEEPGYEEIAA